MRCPVLCVLLVFPDISLYTVTILILFQVGARHAEIHSLWVGPGIVSHSTCAKLPEEAGFLVDESFASTYSIGGLYSMNLRQFWLRNFVEDWVCLPDGGD